MNRTERLLMIIIALLAAILGVMVMDFNRLIRSGIIPSSAEGFVQKTTAIQLINI